jgi:hypothetical protein
MDNIYLGRKTRLPEVGRANVRSARDDQQVAIVILSIPASPGPLLSSNIEVEMAAPSIVLLWFVLIVFFLLVTCYTIEETFCWICKERRLITWTAPQRKVLVTGWLVSLLLAGLTFLVFPENYSYLNVLWEGAVCGLLLALFSIWRFRLPGAYRPNEER